MDSAIILLSPAYKSYIKHLHKSNYIFLLPEMFVARFKKDALEEKLYPWPIEALANACCPLCSDAFRNRHGHDSPYLFCRVSQ